LHFCIFILTPGPFQLTIVVILYFAQLAEQMYVITPIYVCSEGFDCWRMEEAWGI